MINQSYRRELFYSLILHPGLLYIIYKCKLVHPNLLIKKHVFIKGFSLKMKLLFVPILFHDYMWSDVLLFSKYLSIFLMVHQFVSAIQILFLIFTGLLGSVMQSLHVLL